MTDRPQAAAADAPGPARRVSPDCRPCLLRRCLARRVFRPAAARRPRAWAALAALALLAAHATAADWPTFRGNVERTGSLDDRPGPKAPKVRWVHKAQEHFVGSPALGAGSLLVPGLGAFNTGLVHALALEGGAAGQIRWTKTAPYVTRPTVCSPAVADGLVVFGDGMHQTDGAVLYAMLGEKGLPVWQYPLPGKLVHLEGTPAVEAGRVYTGGGEAGVLCVDLKRVVLDGREQDLAAVVPVLEQRWAQLVAKYEEDKKKDPNSAVPPSEEALPKPAPKLLWHKGQGTWHVDAPVVVRGDRVLAASAYIDEEKVGRRCLVCLKADDGTVLWEAPLKVNPWAGPTIAGDVVLVGCSSIRFDPKLLGQAKGEVVALGLADGRVRWRKDVPGGVLAPLAVRGDVAVFTATDGRVRAWAVADGAERWAYDAGRPFFAGPAVAGGTVYAADLKAVVHALGLADGKPLWTLDVGAHPSVQTPGHVYGSPLIAGGDLYLATCNLEGDSADQPAVVVCLSDRGPPAAAATAAITVDKARRAVSIPCKVALRKLPNLKDTYPLEVVATLPPPQGQKAHETVVTFDAAPSDVHKALEALGLKPGKPARGEEGAAAGPEVAVFLEYPGVSGRPRLVPIEATFLDSRTGRRVPPLRWFFTGSALRQPDPAKDAKVYGADLSGTLIALFPVTDETVLQTNLTMTEERLLRLDTNRGLLPPEGTPVNLVIQVK